MPTLDRADESGPENSTSRHSSRAIRPSPPHPIFARSPSPPPPPSRFTLLTRRCRHITVALLHVAPRRLGTGEKGRHRGGPRTYYVWKTGAMVPVTGTTVATRRASEPLCARARGIMYAGGCARPWPVLPERTPFQAAPSGPHPRLLASPTHPSHPTPDDRPQTRDELSGFSFPRRLTSLLEILLENFGRTRKPSSGAAHDPWALLGLCPWLAGAENLFQFPSRARAAFFSSFSLSPAFLQFSTVCACLSTSPFSPHRSLLSVVYSISVSQTCRIKMTRLLLLLPPGLFLSL